MTLGRYDMVAVVEVPDDATYAKVMLKLAQKGGVRTESLTAFTEVDYRNIIEAAN